MMEAASITVITHSQLFNSDYDEKPFSWKLPKSNFNLERPRLITQ